MEDKPYLWNGRFNIANISFLVKMAYWLSIIPVKISAELTSWFLYLYGKNRKPSIAKTILKKKT